MVIRWTCMGSQWITCSYGHALRTHGVMWWAAVRSCSGGEEPLGGLSPGSSHYIIITMRWSYISALLTVATILCHEMPQMVTVV